MSRNDEGIGSALLVHVIRLASERDKRLVADFIDTGRNRVMYITYKLMGFEEAGTDESSEGGDMIELVYREAERSNILHI